MFPEDLRLIGARPNALLEKVTNNATKRPPFTAESHTAGVEGFIEWADVLPRKIWRDEKTV